ncbi:putative copper amine oxidase [Echria macrotheca]|uniref:Amine oxidase n=1 Tax=Echria macrotheca TaxID=438768 RepID=A0AAJ0BKX3_9PEZI|nr:putative copper amine oxidase [Echria macrotheca]
MLTRSLAVAFLAAAAPVVARPDISFWKRAMSPTNDTRSCGVYDSAPTVKAPKVNPWAQISPADVTAVWDLVHAPESGLNLTHPDKATLTDNYVYFIDTLHTNKSAVLPYIDGDGPQPAKYARVVIFEGGKEEPVSQEYMVGPLPVTPETSIQKLDYIFNGGKGGAVPFNARYFDGKRSQATDALLTSVMAEINDITIALFGGAYYGSGDKRTNMTAASPTPVSYDGTQAFRTIMFRYPGLSSYLTPIDFYVILDIPGTDPSKYTLRGIVTNERFFATVAEFRAAYDAGEIKNEFPQTRDQTWGLLDLKEDMGVRDLDDRLAPQSIEIGGKRYKVDVEQQYVEFMGWSFYLSFTRTLGLMMFDIKFKGERVMYELSLQEAAAQYAGFQPKAANTVYHDTYYSIGTYSSTLVEGYDCPFGATMLNISFPEGNGTQVHPQALCLYEADSGFPVSRHRTGSGNDYGFSRIGSVKGSALHLRHIATIGNYDYMFNYAFHVDASIEVEVRASGYLQSSPYYKNQSNFGPRIYEGTQGSFHDHILTFKADFDILDTKNSLQVTELKVVNQSQPWFPELGVFEQMELETSVMAEEQQFNWAPNNQKMYCVVSDKTNIWGEKRGYRMVPGKSNVHLSIMNSPFTRDQSTLLKTNLAVTKVHDSEPYANSWQNINLPWAPQQDFGKFFDGESVDGEDLAVWFNLGMHHFTRAEDIPVTLYSEAVSSIVFAPQNFFDRAQDGDLRNRRWVVAEAGEPLAYEDYGVPLADCNVKLEEPVTKILPWDTVY